MKTLLQRALVPVACLPEALRGADDEPAALCDVTLDGPAIVTVERTGAPAPDGVQVDDLGGDLVFPGFLDAHVHLDKTHTWRRAPNRSHTFAEAIDTLWRDKVNWSAEDLHRRAGFALRSARAHGTVAMRTHVDTGLPWAETSFAALAELRDAWRGDITLQLVSLCGVDGYAGPEGEALVDLPMRFRADALGGMPVMNPDLPAQLDRLMAIARDRAIGLDLHVDENGDAGAECLRAVAEAVLRNGFPHPVVCGHCCSLAVQAPARAAETLRLVREAGLGIVSLPLCNLYLQDRPPPGAGARTPRWRGLTLLHEFLAQGTPLACASDNVRDAFYAYGDYDLFEVYLHAIRAGHLDAALARSPEVVTTGPARLMGLRGAGVVAPGASARLVRFAAKDFSELLSRPGAPRRIWQDSGWRAPKPPEYAELSR